MSAFSPKSVAFPLTEHAGLGNTNMVKSTLCTNYSFFFIEHDQKTMNYCSVCVTYYLADRKSCKKLLLA